MTSVADAGTVERGPAADYRIVSVDDHLIEPRDLFEGRMPAGLADAAPKIVTFGAREVWEYEGGLYPNIGLNAVVGRPRDQWSMEPANFDEMRRGCWDIDARIADMDLAGIQASVCFPSLIAGFSGAVFSRSKDPDLGLACVRAWNDWHHDVWAGTYPGRMIPTQITWLLDPEIAASMVRENAARGFRALSFTEFPAKLGLPSLHTGHWDPLLAACAETGTVLCLHTGSASWAPIPCDDPPFELLPTLFPVNAFIAASDWLWSGVCTRFPDLKIALSEGGVGWVNMLADRADYVLDHSGSGNEGGHWKDDQKPSEVLGRNFWFCTIDDPSTLEPVIDRFGPEHVMLEVDYPHADSSWPDTQKMVHETIGHLPDAVIAKLTHENAEELFRWPTP
ncbi:MAG: putative TIM-barrel fold metal-dependent hydrolase [Actinomycetia bacterium]|nr:putative TIM-barrel fold metal-dependent hydrolase [Actinomycetes bacterium]